MISYEDFAAGVEELFFTSSEQQQQQQQHHFRPKRISLEEEGGREVMVLSRAHRCSFESRLVVQEFQVVHDAAYSVPVLYYNAFW